MKERCGQNLTNKDTKNIVESIQRGEARFYGENRYKVKLHSKTYKIVYDKKPNKLITVYPYYPGSPFTLKMDLNAGRILCSPRLCG